MFETSGVSRLFELYKKERDNEHEQYIQEKARRIIAETSLQKIETIINNADTKPVVMIVEVDEVLDEAKAQKIKLFNNTKIIQCEKYEGKK